MFHAARPVGVREDRGPADDRRLRAPQRGRGPHRGPAGLQRSQEGPCPDGIRNIGVVFQDYAVWPHMTVFDNVVYPAADPEVPAAEAEGTARWRPSARCTSAAWRTATLAALRRAAAAGGPGARPRSRPQIMLLDEPLTNLDANLREEMRFEIKDLQRRTGCHDPLRHPRPGGGAGHLRPRSASWEGGPPPADRVPARDLHQPGDGFVFNFLGVANFLPVERKNGAVHSRGATYRSRVGSPRRRGAHRQGRGGGRVPALRDRPRPRGRGLRGRVRRRVFLGPIVTYFIEVGASRDPGPAGGGGGLPGGPGPGGRGGVRAHLPGLALVRQGQRSGRRPEP